jgi:hypothetical protein
MKWMLTIALILSTVIYYPSKIIAQTKQPATTKQPAQPARTSLQKRRTSGPVFVWPKTPKRLSPISGRRAGMGSRDNCPVVATALTALVPLREEQGESKQTNTSSAGIVEGLTTSERPTFWFYMPYTQNSKASAEFSLQDSTGNDVYKGAVSLPTNSGVISISLPSNTSLQVGKIYRWYLKVRCDRQRTASVPQEKVAIYAEEGIWFDSLNMLAQLYLSNPKDASVAADWQSLLRSVNLDNIATVSLMK